MANNSKTCFVICPIDDPESEVRRRSDQILKHIIEPVVGVSGYEVLRSDLIPEPGVITSQVIEHLLQDDLVIADLTDGNPNVYYELAVRHVTRKPFVQIILKGQKHPFDVSVQRTIPFDHRDLDSVSECKEELKKQIKAIENDPKAVVHSPISQAIDILSLSKSEQPVEQQMAKILRMLERISDAVCTSEIPRTNMPTLRDIDQWRSRPFKPAGATEYRSPESGTIDLWK